MNRSSTAPTTQPTRTSESAMEMVVDQASGGWNRTPDRIFINIPNISRIFSPEDGSARFTIEGVTSGNADGADCQGTLPDFYTFVAQEKVREGIKNKKYQLVENFH